MKQHRQQLVFQPLGRWLNRIMPSPQYTRVLGTLLVLILLGYCMAH